MKADWSDWRLVLAIFIGLMVSVFLRALFNLSAILNFIILVTTTAIFLTLFEKGKQKK